MFYFQNLFNTALSGIDTGGATGGVVQVAQYILLAALVFGVFQAWAQGGDTQLLGVTGVRFFAMSLILLNYTSAFRDVNGMFNTVASFIDNSTAGGADVFTTWTKDIGKFWQDNGMSQLWGLITGAAASFIESIPLVVGYMLFPITYALFSLLYALYGSILYVVGPFVLALYPATGVGSLARTYVLNLMVFNGWGVLYSIFSALMAAIHLNSVDAVLNAGSFLGGFAGLSQSFLLGLASILLSLCILLIPFLAKKIVEGDVGHTMTTIIRTTMMATGGVGSLLKGGR